MDYRKAIAGYLTREPVEVPEWKDPETGKPVTVWVTDLSGLDRYTLFQEVKPNDGELIEDDTFSLKLLVRSLRDESNKRIFTDKETQFIGQNITIDSLLTLYKTAKRVSGLEDESVEDAKKN